MKRKSLVLGLSVAGVVLLGAAAAIALTRTTPAPDTAVASTAKATALGAHTSRPTSPTETSTASPPTSSPPQSPKGVPAGAALTAPGSQLSADNVAGIGLQDGSDIYYIALQASAPERVTGETAAAALNAAHHAAGSTVYRAKITARALSGSVTAPTAPLLNITIITHPGSSELTNAAQLVLEQDAGLLGDTLTVTTTEAASWYVYAFSDDGNTPIGVQYATPAGQYAAPVTWVDATSKQILIP